MSRTGTLSLTGKPEGFGERMIELADGESVLQPRAYIVRLPAVYDPFTRQVHRAYIEMFLYEPQAEALRVKDVMHAVGFTVDRDGIEMWLMHGNLRERPENWAEAFDALGLSGSYAGLNGLAALQAIALYFRRRKAPHGARGKGKKNQAARDLLLAAVLLRMSRGSSQQRAVCDALAEYERVVPWPFHSAEAALTQIVKRFRRAALSFVPSRPNRP